MYDIVKGPKLPKVDNVHGTLSCIIHMSTRVFQNGSVGTALTHEAKSQSIGLDIFNSVRIKWNSINIGFATRNDLSLTLYIFRSGSSGRSVLWLHRRGQAVLPERHTFQRRQEHRDGVSCLRRHVPPRTHQRWEDYSNFASSFSRLHSFWGELATGKRPREYFKLTETCCYLMRF